MHGTAVAVEGQGALILGPSGSGKSALALQLLGLGAVLVADDQVHVVKKKPELWLTKPESLPSAIEARGLGLLNAPLAGPTQLSFVIDMGQIETERLPTPRQREILGIRATLINRVEGPHFPSAVFHYLRFGRADL